MRFMPNPFKSENGSSKPKHVGIHNGFCEYMYGTESPGESLPHRNDSTAEDSATRPGKCGIIIEQIAALCQEYPEYRIYITGHSLCSALATLFAFEVAASADPRIPKPVTCISIASPKVGNMDFRHAVTSLEKRRLLRCLRVANVSDPITKAPKTPPLLVALPMFLVYHKRTTYLYRHVGTLLKLYHHELPERETFQVLAYPSSDRFHLEGVKQVKRFTVGICLCLGFCIPAVNCMVGSSFV